MQRTHLAGLTGLIGLTGLGGYLVCTPAADCEDPGYLTVSVVQADGDGFKPARVPAVTYTVADDPRDETGPAAAKAAPLSADCLDDGCTKWRAAPGDNGEITVKAEVCGQTFENVALVDRGEDGCNLAQREVELVVDLTACGPEGAPTPQVNAELGSEQKNCTMELRPSIQLYAWKRHSDYLAPAIPESVKYRWYGEHKPGVKDPKPTCIDELCTGWALGAEMEGGFEIDVTSCGKTQTLRVDVPREDVCHVDTQRVDVLLEGIECLTSTPQGTWQPPGGGPQKDETTPPPKGPGDELEKGCDPEDPSKETAFIAYLVKQHDDMLVPVKTESLTYTIEGKEGMWRAECEAGGNEICNRWVAPSRGDGEYVLNTKICDKDTSMNLRVPPGEKGCGVVTQVVMWDADKTGCLSGVKPGDDAPAPPTNDAKLAAEPPANPEN